MTVAPTPVPLGVPGVALVSAGMVAVVHITAAIRSIVKQCISGTDKVVIVYYVMICLYEIDNANFLL